VGDDPAQTEGQKKVHYQFFHLHKKTQYTSGRQWMAGERGKNRKL